MISQEFKAAIRSKNYLRARIMLKNSLLIDPTFVQFCEMLKYAKKELPDIVVPYDKAPLENDTSKWNQDLMNLELVQLVDNFSNERIDHLKNIIKTTMKEKITKISANTKAKNRQKAVNNMVSEGRVIRALMGEAERKGNKRSRDQIDKMECAARNMLEAITRYKANR